MVGDLSGKIKKVLSLVEERNWKEMEEWLHDDFMYIKETALMDREQHEKKNEKRVHVQASYESA